MGDIMTFPKRWEDFLHDYEFEDARRIYTNGSRLIPSFRVKQMMEHYAPVVHGRWIEHEETQEDAYSHHKCSECNVNAPFYYKMREDWDEGMDGEWYSIGLVDDGINEYLTDYCPNCGAKMDEVSE